MPRAPGSVPAHRAELLAEFCGYLAATGRRYALYREAACRFLVRWPVNTAPFSHRVCRTVQPDGLWPGYASPGVARG
jgi:hypothetical protein